MNRTMMVLVVLMALSGAVVRGAPGRPVWPLKELLRQESAFLKPGIGYNPATSLTNDGVNLQPATRAVAGARNWTSGAKESLHLILLAKAAAGDPDAGLLIAPEDPAAAPAAALALLTRKLATYQRIQAAHPTFGGFLPWLKSDAAVPTKDELPAVDNGQFAFAIYFVAKILPPAAGPVKQDYARYHERLSAEVVHVFLDQPRQRLRGVSVPPEEEGGDYVLPQPQAPYYQTDSFDGDLLAMYAGLFGHWPTPALREAVWQDKVHDVFRLATVIKGQSVAIRAGHVYSAHECWPFLILPYADVDFVRAMFVNGEIARTWYSAERGIPGLAAATNNPAGNTYLSHCGIDCFSLALRYLPENVREDVVAPYAAFPVILADHLLGNAESVGLAWLKTMTTHPAMVGPVGVGESITVDGRRVSPVATWDGKMTTVVALLGGTGDALREALREDGKYDDFLALVAGEFAAFGGVTACPLPLHPPTAKLPTDFRLPAPLQTAPAEAPVTTGEDILPKLQLSSNEGTDCQLRNGVLQVRTSRGFSMFDLPMPVDLERRGYLVIRKEPGVGGTVYLELKNAADQPLVRQTTVHSVWKVRIGFPKEAAMVSVNLAELLIKDVPGGYLAKWLFLSDPELTGELLITALEFCQAPPKEAAVDAKER